MRRRWLKGKDIFQSDRITIILSGNGYAQFEDGVQGKYLKQLFLLCKTNKNMAGKSTLNYT